MKNLQEPPEAIIITIGAKMIGDNGYRHWLKNFLHAMEKSERDSGWAYWLRQGKEPKQKDNLQYVYLCIGGKIRYRVYFGGSTGPREMLFEGRTDTIFGKAWVLIAGPIQRAPYVIKRKGFQGFRYTEKLF